MMYNKNELKVKVEKDNLVRVLKENRKKHEAEYLQAKKGFRKLLIEELERKLVEAKSGNKVELRFENRTPDNNIEGYDDVIGMLELATDTEIELNHSQYKQWFEDDWDWKQGWDISNAAYLSAGPYEED